MELIPAKLFSMLVLGVGSLIAGILPSVISERSRRKHPFVLSCLLCFGAGVLLATSLVHMLPEARRDLPEDSELFLCLGFLLIYLVDEIVHCFKPGLDHRQVDRKRDYGSTSSQSTERNSSMEDGRKVENETSPLCHVSHTEPCTSSLSGVISLLCALFVHSLLEGLAIGLQKSSTEVMLLFGAVASHKFVVGFCLGAELCAGPAGPGLRLAMIVLFSAGSVLGIAVGAGLEAVSQLRESTIVPIMQALAAGTLLYVTVSEVLPRERARWHARGRRRAAGSCQLVAVAFGFGLMCLTTKYLDHGGV